MHKKEPIRVLHILQRMEQAGVQTLLMNIYKNIDRDKIQFDFLVHYKTPYFFDEEIKKMGGKIYRLSFREDYNIIKYLKDLNSFFRNHPEYKIVHGHMHSLGVVYLHFAKKHNVPVRIAHSHTNFTQKDKKHLLKRIMCKLYSKNATHLFACSKSAGEYMFGSKNFTVINNAIDSAKFIFDERKRNKKRKELGIDKNFVVGCVGRFEIQKNQKFAVEIFRDLIKKCPDSKLIFIGTGRLESEVKDLVRNYNLEKSIQFLGNRNDMVELFQAMDVFLFPSLFEGLGIVAVEAQAAGTPVVCSDNLPMEINVTPLINRVSLSNPTNDWVNSILESKNNKAKKTDTSNYIRQKKYDIKIVAKELEDFYLKNW